MSWLKIEHDLPDKPEPFQMAGILGIDPDAVVGKLLRVWIWADKHTSIDDTGDGYASVTVLPLLNRIAGVTDFTDAMIKAGWLVVDGDTLRFPHLGRHNGKTAKDRALSACRMAEHRARKENSCASVAPPLRSERNNSVTREEKRREEKNIATEQQGAVAPAAGAASPFDDNNEAPPLALSNEPPPKPRPPVAGAEKLAAEMAALEKRKERATAGPPVPIPIILDTEPFRLRWASWLQYRREMKKPLTPTSQAQQLDNFLKLGEARAIAMIEHTITMGWQGLREPDAPAASNGAPAYLQLPTPEERAASRAREPIVYTPEELDNQAFIKKMTDEHEARQAAKAAAKAKQEPKP